MTQERIIKLAYNEALRLWHKEYELLEKRPNNELTHAREKRAWDELMELEELRKSIHRDRRGARSDGRSV